LPIVNYAAALNELAAEISDTAEGKGFWDYEAIGDDGLIPTKLALVHSEVSEALAVHRNDYDDDDLDATTGMTPMQEDDFAEEVADIIIRCLDLVGYYGLDIGNIVLDKMEKNRGRPYRHGKRY
jgi:NTP pyrophosphatase (non-canonical NTP hydrolase)